MYIELITVWDTFTNTNINNTLFCATLLFFKRKLFKRISRLRFCQTHVPVWPNG